MVRLFWRMCGSEWNRYMFQNSTVDSRYNAAGYNAVLDITLIISGPRSNKKHVK